MFARSKLYSLLRTKYGIKKVKINWTLSWWSKIPCR